jgi:hypothetical protein
MNIAEALIFVGGMFVGAGAIIGLAGLAFAIWIWRSE